MVHSFLDYYEIDIRTKWNKFIIYSYQNRTFGFFF